MIKRVSEVQELATTTSEMMHYSERQEEKFSEMEPNEFHKRKTFHISWATALLS